MKRRADRQATVLRHRLGARLLHAVAATFMLALIVTGLGMAGRLPRSVAALLGGHLLLGDTHRWLGIVFGTAAIALLLFGPAAARLLIRDMCRFRRGDVAWFRSFVRYVWAPSRNRPLSHDGRFDPGQRVVFVALLASFALLVVSAAALFLAPPGATSLLAWSLRVHIASAVVLLAALAVHTIAGSGLLVSHRGVGRVMFGDGRIRRGVAETLWPQWAATQEAGEVAGPSGDRRPEVPDAENVAANALRRLDLGRPQ